MQSCRGCADVCRISSDLLMSVHMGLKPENMKTPGTLRSTHCLLTVFSPLVGVNKVSKEKESQKKSLRQPSAGVHAEKGG